MTEALEPDRKQWGFAITEAGVSRKHGQSFKDKVVNAKKWTEIDTDELIMYPHPDGWDPGKMDKPKLLAVLGLPSTTTEDELNEWMRLQVATREILRDLMQEAAFQLQKGTETDFYKNPLATIQTVSNACHTTEKNTDGSCKVPLTLRDLQTMLHMFNKVDGSEDPNFNTQRNVEDEIRRRIKDELANNDPWEGKHPGVWNRNGFYCGCGRSL